ncbi:hypothetical protein DPMN_064350 [Dreissena polymorpha]|uniref:Uncharacterized protein n=1 Tax=Dreissena polymorpha TaxID=45954 RepID=A0A9D4HL28_DREPO|nr:hypothetical protein DPMN_064350 [Dreissena polymorpha]
MKTAESNTPRRQTDELMRSAGFTKQQSRRARKQLLFPNVVQSELQKSQQRIKRGERGVLGSLIGGRIISKYRLARSENKSTGLGRNTLSGGRSSCLAFGKLQKEERLKDANHKAPCFRVISS